MATKKTTNTVTPVKGGWVTRNARTGQFSAVQTSDGPREKVSAETLSSVKKTSEKRGAALRRLADR